MVAMKNPKMEVNFFYIESKIIKFLGINLAK